MSVIKLNELWKTCRIIGVHISGSIMAGHFPIRLICDSLRRYVRWSVIWSLSPSVTSSSFHLTKSDWCRIYGFIYYCLGVVFKATLNWSGQCYCCPRCQGDRWINGGERWRSRKSLSESSGKLMSKMKLNELWKTWRSIGGHIFGSIMTGHFPIMLTCINLLKDSASSLFLRLIYLGWSKAFASFCSYSRRKNKKQREIVVELKKKAQPTNCSNTRQKIWGQTDKHDLW